MVLMTVANFIMSLPFYVLKISFAHPTMLLVELILEGIMLLLIFIMFNEMIELSHELVIFRD